MYSVCYLSIQAKDIQQCAIRRKMSAKLNRKAIWQRAHTEEHEEIEKYVSTNCTSAVSERLSCENKSHFSGPRVEQHSLSG